MFTCVLKKTTVPDRTTVLLESRLVHVTWFSSQSASKFICLCNHISNLIFSILNIPQL